MQTYVMEFGSKNGRACGEVVSWEKATCASWGEVAGYWGQVDYTGKPYWPHPGAKFGHVAGVVEAK